jgi:hypothetical protein
MAQHHAAIVAVDDLARRHHQEDRCHELGEPDQAELQGTVGELVDMPADHNRDHLERGGGGNARDEQQAEGANPEERRVGVDLQALDRGLRACLGAPGEAALVQRLLPPAGLNDEVPQVRRFVRQTCAAHLSFRTVCWPCQCRR